mgnify:CR=1 FL=1
MKTYTVNKNLLCKNIDSINIETNLRFSGILFRFCKFLCRTFSKKYAFNVKTPTEPCVYLCRHLNLHGAIAINKSSRFDFQTYVLSVFTKQKTCFKQFYNYTFSKRINKSKFIAFLPALFAGFWVPLICKSGKTIPVYRNNAESVKTIKNSLKSLMDGKNLLIFPDVDYAQTTKEEKREIYSGFLCVEKLYYKKTGRHVKFISLVIDEKNKSINELDAISFSGKVPFAFLRSKI